MFFTGVGIDGEVSKTLQKIMTKQGMKFKLGTKVTGVKKEGDIVKVSVEAAKGGNQETVSFVLLFFYCNPKILFTQITLMKWLNKNRLQWLNKSVCYSVRLKWLNKNSGLFHISGLL